MVGAGPAGALSALLLAKQGWRVDVYERAAPPLDEQGKAQVSAGSIPWHVLTTSCPLLHCPLLHCPFRKAAAALTTG